MDTRKGHTPPTYSKTSGTQVVVHTISPRKYTAGVGASRYGSDCMGTDLRSKMTVARAQVYQGCLVGVLWYIHFYKHIPMGRSGSTA